MIFSSLAIHKGLWCAPKQTIAGITFAIHTMQISSAGVLLLCYNYSTGLSPHSACCHRSTWDSTISWDLQTTKLPSSKKPHLTEGSWDKCCVLPLVLSHMDGNIILCYQLLGPKTGCPGEGGNPHLTRVPPILWSVMCGRAAIYLPLILEWAFLYPILQGVAKGQPYLEFPELPF